MIHFIVTPGDVVAGVILILGALFIIYALIDAKVREWRNRKEEKDAK